MRYAMARCKQHRNDLAYRIYISDCEKAICDIAIGLAGGKGLKHRYIDLIDENSQILREETRNESDIINSIKAKLNFNGLREVKNGHNNSNC